ncbi:hypothetical protein Bca52824_035322 [Brassica carinata]|uniref:Agenet domain-containing protein n=1 Tax=Brassica carinata TaxID=52824 RepID=A0A8X7S2H5_BRACI|nr:hypothetical protein Bca52824_035322 [Brassica carinata]
MGVEKLTVEYSTLFADQKRVQDTITTDKIHPAPPTSDQTAYEMYENVEGLYNNGWCSGQVRMVLRGIPDESSMFTEVPMAEPAHELNQNPHHKWKPKAEQCVVQVQKPKGEIGTGNQGEYKANKEQEVHIAMADLKE